MNTVTTWQTSSTSSASTEQLAAAIGSRLRGGEIIELISDLGGGKTTFVRGLSRGMGSADHVASPTFTISRQYRAGSLTLYHFDFYRLSGPGIMAAELSEVLGEPDAVTVLEWGGTVRDMLPADRLTVRLKRTGDNSRRLFFSYPGRLAYLVPEAAAC